MRPSQAKHRWKGQATTDSLKMAMVSGYPWLPAFILIPIGSLNPDLAGILPVLNYQIRLCRNLKSSTSGFEGNPIRGRVKLVPKGA